MSLQQHLWPARVASGALSLLLMAGCRGKSTAQAPDMAAPAGPQTVDVVKVVSSSRPS